MRHLLLILLLIIEMIKSQCNIGCLRCSLINTCFFCDFSSLYYPNANNTCILSARTNCSSVDLTGNCISCIGSNQYIDPTTFNCIQISAANLVSNCILYSNNGSCTACTINFFLSNGTCIAITTAIPNCVIYSSTITCKTCGSGFFPSNGSGSCIKLATSQNCLAYSQITCASCNTGYIFSSYGYLKNMILGNSANLEITQRVINLFKTGGINTGALQTCVLLPNCFIVNLNLTCAVCSNGFFLNSTTNLCQSNPNLPIIVNCQLFSILQTCVSCLPGYFLANNTTCLAIVPVQNCATYDPTANFTSCLNCQKEFYLTVLGNCQSRNYTIIQACLTFSPFNDFCQTCLTGYNLTSDFLGCLPFTQNCVSYQPSTLLSTSLICNQCAGGYYLDSSSKCQYGTIVNCVVYNNATSCSSCANGFLLQSNTCVVAANIPGCSLYSQTINNFCSKCNANFVQIKTAGNCVNFNTIPLCNVYNTLTTCGQCQNGAALSQSGTCNSIVAASCAVYNLTTCVQCAAPNIFDQITGNCRPIAQVYNQNCVSNMINGTNPGEIEGCRTCQQNSMFFNYNNGAFCFEVSLLASFNGVSFDNNCAIFKYQSSSNNFICVRCKTGFFLPSTGICNAVCSTTIYPFFLQTFQTAGIYNMNQQIQLNTCGTNIANCLIGSFNLIQSSTTPVYSCAVCQPGFLSLVTMSSGNVFSPLLNTLVTAFTPVSFAPVLTCSSTSASTLGLLNTTNFVPSCDYYYALPNQPTIGCLKCSFGNSGIVLNYIGFCLTFTGNACNQCRNMYYLSSSTSCLPVVLVNNCIIYDGTAPSTSCIQCITTHFVSAPTVCTTRTYFNAACLTYNFLADQCTSCANNFVLLSFQCYSVLTNCVTHALSNGNVICTACNLVVSYLSGNVCLVGTVTNCNSYSSTQVNICLGCSLGLSVAENQCVTTLTAAGNNGFCQAIAPSSSTTCFLCQRNTFKFTFNNQCKAITPVTNCKSYVSQTLCGVCNNLFTLSANQLSCTTTSAALNCITYVVVDLNADGVITSADQISGSVFLYTCTLCSPGYLLFVKSTTYTYNGNSVSSNTASCVINSFDYTSTNCITDASQTGLLAVQDMTCSGQANGCKTGFFPFNFENLMLCVQTSYINDIRPTTLGTNCRIYAYSTTTGTYLCSVCNFGYGLQSGSCVTTCTGANTFIALKQYQFSTTGAAGLQVIAENVCLTIPTQTPAIPANCLMVAPEYVLTNSPFRYGCVQCASGYTAIMQPPFTNNILTAYNAFGGSLTSAQIGSALTAYPSIALCLNGNVNTNYVVRGSSNNANLPIPNCRYMMKLSSTNSLPVIGCFTCNPGYSGTINTSSGDSNDYINQCILDSTLSATQPYTGFQNNDNVSNLWGSIISLFSSTTCTTASNTPVVYKAVDTTTMRVQGLFRYTKSIQSSPNVMLSTNSNLDIFCVTPTAGNLGVSSVPSFFTNCALILVNVGGYSTVTNTGTNFQAYNPFCMACKPGYLPTYSTQFSQVITGCNLITIPTGGSIGTNLNMISCIYQISTVSLITTVNYQTCTTLSLSSNLNCFAAITSTTCAVCNPGFNVNSVGQCANIALSTCSGSTTFTNEYKTVFAQSNGFYPLTADNSVLFFSNVYIGCQTCANTATHTLIQMSRTNDPFITNQVCTTNNNVFNVNLSPFFDTNCVNYGFGTNSAITCLICATNFILRINTVNSCVAQSGFPNCQTVSGTTSLCTICASNYMLVNNLCVLISSLSTNCLTWDTVSSASSSFAVCSICKTGFVLSSNSQTCSTMATTLQWQNCATGKGTLCTVCNAGFVLIATSSNPSYCYPISTINAGLMDHDQNCATLLNNGSTFAFTNYFLTCSSCTSGFYPSTPNLVNWCYRFYASSNPEPAGCISYYTTQPALSAFAFNCIECSLSTYYLSTNTCILRTQITNCQTYSSTTNTCSVCISPNVLASANSLCNAPPTPPVIPLKYTLTSPSGFIHQCTSINNCANNVWIYGLTSPLSLLFSCHQCLTSPNIPFIAIDGGSTYSGIRSLLEYNFNSTGIAPLSNYIGGSAIFCANPIAASFNIPSNLFTFPTNCALGVNNINAGVLDASHATLSTSVNLGKIAVFCVACKPGFTPLSATSTTGSSISLMVSSCIQIQNCIGFSWFNLCSQCQTNYAYLISASGIINYSACLIFSQDPNCMVIRLINSVYSCKICQLGFYINPVGLCERILAPLCNTIQFDNGFDGVSIFAGLAWQPYAGCTACSSNLYLPTIMTNNTNVCHSSPYLISAVSLPFPLFARNCVSFLNKMETPGYILCGVCSPNWFLNAGNSCISTLPQGCSLPINSTYCAICQNSFLTINGVCTTPSIANCTQYVTTNTPVQICLACAPTYYLLNNICVLGTVLNCLSYSSLNVCSGCVQGYGLMRLSNSTIVCVLINLSSNCATFSTTNFDQMLISCATCQVGAIPQTLPEINQRSTCFPITSITNCIAYDINSKFSTSSFNCTQCYTGYYLSQNSCIQRSMSAVFCLIADPKSDSCFVCQNGNTLNSTNSCVPPPPIIGTIGCIIYDGSLKCLTCGAGFYLFNSTCFVVNSTSLIANCSFYTPQITCANCSAGYYLTQTGTCLAASATNCLTAVDKFTCSSCSPGFGLISSNNVINCVKISINLCLILSNLFPYNCVLCNANFYPTATGCAQVVNTIANCIYYSADGVCQTCSSAYALNRTSTGTSCVSTSLALGYQDPNCQYFNFYQNGTCVLCSAGYFLSNNVCVNCLMPNCLVCDPSNNIRNCLICQPGSYQMADGICIQINQTQISGNTTNATNQSNFTIVKSLSRILVSIWIVMCAVLVI